MNELLLSTVEQSDLERLSLVVDRTKRAFEECGKALEEIRDRKLWRGEAKNFAEFCHKRFGFTKRRGDQIIAASKVTLALPPKTITMVLTERQARALSDVPEDRRPDVIKQAAKNGEVTAKAIEQAAKRIEPEAAAVDAMGFPLPDATTKFWTLADEVKSLRNELRRIKALIVAAAEATPKMFVESNIQAITIHLQNAFSDLGNSIPYAVCPSCQGQNSSKCQLCRGRGLISKFRWNVTVPEELKTLRQKQIQKLAK